jgi:large subunit ribosomal protein L25
MVELILRAEPRTVLGKQVKQLRRAGRLPGVVYGPLLGGTHPVTVDTRELSRFYHTFGASTLFTLQWEGGREQVFIREVQVDPVRHTPVHVDFFAPNLRKDTTALVPLTFGEENPVALGILSTVQTEVSVTGLPGNIPAAIDVDISNLVEIGDSLRIGDLVVPEGITVDLDDEDIVVHRIAEAAPEPVEETEAEAVEGEETEGEVSEDTESGSEPSGGSEGSDS